MEFSTNFDYNGTDYYLCYMDEYNSLNIIEDIFLKVAPFESNVRRFYLIGDFNNKIIHTEVLLKGSNKYGYETKVCVNKEDPMLSDFISSSNSLALLNELQPVFENVIPIDILLTSHNSIESNVCLDINISISETNITSFNLTDKVVLGMITSGGYYDVTINGNTFNTSGFKENSEDLKRVFAQYNIEVVPLDNDFNEVLPVEGYYDNVSCASFYNISGDNVDIEIKIADANYITEYHELSNGKNSSVIFDENNGSVSFSLSSEAYSYIWELKSGILVEGQGRYTFTKGLQELEVNTDLTEAIITSLSDADMQQWQAVKDAANELTGVTDWVLDPANNRIRYFELKDEVDGGASFGCNGSTSNSQTLQSALDSCTLPNWTQVKLTQKGNETLVYTLAGMQVGQTKSVLLEVSVVDTNNSNPTPVDTNIYISVTKVGQPAEQEEKYLPLETVAAQVISNAQSDNEGVSLFAETYLESIVNSVNETDTTKQFVKLDYLKSLLPL